MKRTCRPFQSSVAGFFQDFLRYHRALGKRFDTEERALRLFDQYLLEQGVQQLADMTPALFQAFLNSRPRPVAKSYNHLLGVLRRWSEWLVRQQRLAESPLRARPRRQTAIRIPFLFDPSQVRQLLALAEQLPDNNHGRQRGLIYATIFALLYGLGLRVGEVARLRLGDVDWDRGILTIQNTKFAKSRLVPFGPRLAAKLVDYRGQRERLWGPLAESDPLFSFDPEKTRTIHPGTITQTFHQLWPRLNISLPGGVAAPRLHCLRHSFAVNTLLSWYRAGINPNERLVQLSTFMGHAHPSSTAVYLTITADLFQEANRRFERFAGPLLKEVAL
ncbi:MAG: tyrosine-type recombinase/integrase [Verrucomicrobia bacterium]|nr:tyrosine-type recombinase/integrase [Verrucomicrobiota bacterium]